MSHIAEAAEAIHALISSSPRTPSREAIAAAIGKALAAPSVVRDAYLASTWCCALEKHLEARSRISADEDDAHNALDARLGDVAKAICARPVRTPDDVIERAAVAVHYWGVDTSNPDPDCTERYALAAVVRGVLDLAGLRFDAEGRLL